MSIVRRLFNFHGGVKPDSRKLDSTTTPIAQTPLPARLTVPLGQSVGESALALVQPGQRVLKGERIGAADGNVSSAVHAPTSGTVLAVGMGLMAHPSGLPAPAVIIEPDGEDAWAPLERVNVRGTPADELRDILRDAGIVGLGGAVFPSHLKLKPGKSGQTRTLVLNGAECEPYITCDDMLMRERADGIVRGASLMADAMNAGEVLVGIEDNKPQAIESMRTAASAAGDERIRVVPVPTRYPAGGAKQLTYVLTGIQVPHGRRSTDYGVQCFNVGTAWSIHQALDLGQPLISRIVTVAGNVDAPRNYEVLLGTPMCDVVRLSGPRPDTNRYIMGGPMMGLQMPSFDVPVTKATNAILAGSPMLFPPSLPEQPCIRCGECARACPAQLQPFELYWFSRAKNLGKAQEYMLFDCIECGCCAYVCPSHIPLVDYYRFAKSEIWAHEREKNTADAARVRFEFRNFRQERETEEKAARLAAKAAETRAKLDQGNTSDTESTGTATTQAGEDPKKALIAAAMARAKAQKAEAQPKNTDHLSSDVEAEITAIENRRARIAADNGEAPTPSPISSNPAPLPADTSPDTSVDTPPTDTAPR